MSLWLTVETALEALRRNVMRTMLTALGIIIGVAAVIVMMALGNGARASIEARIRSAGTNLIIVMPGSATVGGVRLGQGARTTLTPADAEAIRRNVPGVAAVSPGASTRAQVVSATGNWSTQMQGTGADIAAIRDWSLETGSFFTDSDVARAAKVALLGAVVRDQLFGSDVDPTGETIRIANQPFAVLGVLARKGQSAIGQDQDDTVIVPYTTVLKKLSGNTWLTNITVAADSESQIAQVADDIAALLRQRHHLSPTDPDDFAVRTLEEMASVLTSTTNTMTWLLASVAAVSLLVGGIGVMNIMLVSVTERTREIGLRMAIGARKRDIARQFLVESLTLGLAGGIVGILIGVLGSIGLSQAFAWTTSISPMSLVLSFGCAAAIGGFFGLYPARRAAALSPIEALRYE
jgi:putative ABC transport system permease protein